MRFEVETVWYNQERDEIVVWEPKEKAFRIHEPKYRRELGHAVCDTGLITFKIAKRGAWFRWIVDPRQANYKFLGAL